MLIHLSQAGEGAAGAAVQLCLNPIAIPRCMKPVLGVRTGLVLLMSVHSRGLEQQRAVPCWKVQPEKDANDTQRGMNGSRELLRVRCLDQRGKNPKPSPSCHCTNCKAENRAALGIVLWL